jgi:4-aminobutyrate aminotransferase-like enzyme/Ser/Thr protein kinase RdoA (MazF antagonist)
MTDDTPNFGCDDAARIARALFGMEWSAHPLPSERDQNFLLTRDDGEAIVLKIANVREDRSVIEAQQRAMEHVARTFAAVPRVVCALSGDAISSAAAPDGRTHMVWAITRLAGTPLGTIRHHSPQLHRQLGQTVAQLTRALAGFDDVSLHREFQWDLRGGRRVVRQYRPLIADAELASAIDTLTERFDEHTVPRLGSLRTSATHNDLNDYNVLVHGSAVGAESQHVSGIVDFGDMLHGYTVGDLAIAAAYVVLDSTDPLSALWEMVHGYHAVAPLTEDEMGALFGLLSLRLCMSACLGAHQQALNPHNGYLGVSQQAIRRTLPRLARIPFAFAEAIVRDACSLEPVASSGRVRAWLQANAESFAPVLGVDLRTEPSLVLDLSVGSPLVRGDAGENTEARLTPRVFSAMRAAGVSVAVGRYDEPRLLYTAPFFAAGDGTLAERRTIHVGLDLFAEAGTPVFAPFDGAVHLFAEHHALQDYGAVIVLRHVTSDGTEFFTLYGHLSRASLEGLREGTSVARGAPIGALGVPAENGGWTPHLHLQVITSLMNLGSDFPGVGTNSRRAVWRSISPDANLVAGVPAHRFPPAAPSVGEILGRRRAVVGPSVSIAYREPVSIARGWGQYMYDANGRRYLDAYNNVPHVGHAHPRVVEAVASQMSVLSTNTRYLHEGLERYAERLVQTLPDPLRVCYLLNSASEANELALRLARTYTGRRDMLVLEAAYHGNTTSLVDVSPYKHAGPGGAGAPEWVHVAPLADDYRGAHKRGDPEAGLEYAGDLARVIGAVRERSRELAGFIAESCPSVGGQLFFPPGYLAAAYEHVRAAGGLCIADEVQTGLGRIGTHFWAFEAQQVVPDIVVMGKPLGNGHPLAAVVTTRAIADAFDNGMEFFSTFGGNTVSCAAGLAVLDVMRDEDLQSRALRTGAHLLARLRLLLDRHELVGDVRGSGLFLGVELVRDRLSLEPAGAEASYVANRMREEGILLGTDGPHHNVVKIRPPMPFDAEDADFLVDALDGVLGELRAVQ